MVATDSALRITIRIDIPDSAYPSTCIDLAVPRNSSIAEILDEVLTLADAPRISRPWQATTAAGVLIDAAQPLAHTSLAHGSTIVLSPHRDVEPPVLCDAAESFIDHGATRQHTGLTTLSTLVGIILIMCCALSPLTGIIPLGAKFLVVALLTLVVLTRMRSTASLFNDSPDGDSTGALAALSILCLTSVICACLSALSFIVPFPIASSQLSTVPWAGLVTALCGATMLITCHILGAPPLRLTVACATALTVIACTSYRTHCHRVHQCSVRTHLNPQQHCRHHLRHCHRPGLVIAMAVPPVRRATRPTTALGGSRLQRCRHSH